MFIRCCQKVKKAPTLRASLCRILILISANKIDLAHNFSVDFFQQLYYKYEKRLFTAVKFFGQFNSFLAPRI